MSLKKALVFVIVFVAVIAILGSRYESIKPQVMTSTFYEDSGSSLRESVVFPENKAITIVQLKDPKNTKNEFVNREIAEVQERKAVDYAAKMRAEKTTVVSRVLFKVEKKPIHPYIEHDGKIVEDDITVEEAAELIDNFYEGYGCPLEGYGKTFVLVSIKNKLDWRLLPAIAFRESTGGKNLFRDNNPFGWGKSDFDSFDEAIETIGSHLGGSIDNTASFYAGKTNREKLKSYNSEKPDYPDRVISTMKEIDRL